MSYFPVKAVFVFLWGDADLSAVAEKYAIGTAPKVLARVRDAVAAFSVAEIER